MNKPLYEQIESDLKELISSGKISAGEKIPSVSNIRGKYDVSHITALRALKELANENYVEFVGGKGYFAKQSRDYKNGKTLHHAIACMLRPYRPITTYDNYFNEINQAVQRECMMKGFDTIYSKCNMPLEDHLPQEKALETIKETIIEIADKVDGFFIDDRIPDAILDSVMGKIQKPFVVINRKSNLSVDTIIPDNINGARQAAELCLKMNYENFILCSNLNPHNHTTERFDSFRETLLENGIPQNQIKSAGYNIGPYEDTLKEAESKINPELKNLIFTPSDSLARNLADSFTEQGVKFGEKIGIIGFEGMGYASMKKPHVATVNIHPENIGKKAVEILLGRISGALPERPSNRSVPSTLTIGETL